MHLLFAVVLLAHWLLASDLHVEPRPIEPVPLHAGHDTDWALFDSTVAAMRRADPNAQVVILAGDFLAHRFPNDVPLAERTMARIVRTFNAAFPHAQFVIVPGNNDDPCGDYRATPGDPYFAYIAHLWAPLVNRRGAAPRFERDFAQYGWYSARLPVKNARAIALDSVYWSVLYQRCANVNPGAPQTELRWLSQSLDALPAGTRAMVVMHIPPGVDGYATLMTHRLVVVPFMRPDRASALLRELSAHAKRVTFAIAGHQHRDDFRLLGGVPMLIAPSISPIYLNNPAFLRLDVDAGGMLRDYRQYYYDLPTETWHSGNTFDSAYGVQAFSAKTLASIHSRLQSDDDLRARWAGVFMSESDEQRAETVGAWRTYWCAQTQLADTFATCAGVQRRVEAAAIAAIVAALAILGLLVFLGVRLARARRAR